MRSRMKALVSQPLVGMIDGVAASRSRWWESESYAWLGERIDVEPRGERLLAARAERLEAVALRPAARRPADARLLHGRIRRREASEQPQLLLALAEPVQRVPQPGHALAHPLDLVGEETVLVLERAAMRDVHAARNGGDAQHQERQRHHAADPDQRFDERLRYLHGARRARAVRHDHEGPAALRLLAHLFATTSPENASTRHNRVPVLHGPAEWRTRTGRGVRSPSGRLKYGLPGKPSTRANVIRITSLWASGGSQPRLGEQDGRLLDLPPNQI